MVPEDNYTVPPEAEGIESLPPVTKQGPTLLKRSEESRKSEINPPEQQAGAAANTINTSGHTTKRHRQTPSVDAGLITTVPEETEEEDDKNSKAQEPADMDDEHKPEDTPTEEDTTKAPAETTTEEPVEATPAPSYIQADVRTGEIAEGAAAITELSETVQPPSVLTSDSQGLVAVAPEIGKLEVNEQKVESKVPETQASDTPPVDPQALESKKQELQASENSEPPTSSTPTEVTSSEKVETSTLDSSYPGQYQPKEVTADTLDKEVTDKTTEKEPLGSAHQAAHQGEDERALSPGLDLDSSTMKPKAAPSQTTKTEEEEEVPPAEEAEIHPDDVVADPKDGEEATRTVEI